uniref:non-specific serine/threonine protein kinase n=1 Tax=Ananas comosus var. bracteatus TaxID=296719 RepID=A0A6V7QIT9_ANACO|nr:unnamed protein product [Ananas comosus var. bracteatus]
MRFFSLEKLSKLLLLGNSLTGQLPPSVSDCQSLVRLRLGENQLSGEIPKDIGKLQNLVFLDLYGEIPPQLGELMNLEQLDLSQNRFSGDIPSSFGNFSYLNKLILNNNLLTGPLPKSIRNLQKLTMLDLSGNSLSGPVPPEIGFLTSLSISLNLSFNKFVGELPEEMSGLTQSYGNRKKPIDSFAAEIQILGHIRHRNIVKLLGYCSNKCVKLLLYNYISNGNLQQLLEENRNLDWETRYKIAVGSAQGLAYLHHDCVPAILHRDVKCNNILLDSKCEPFLADFGLAKLMNSPNFHHAMSRVAGSYGMGTPPNITEKSDVYSYGVVLLEILTGRSAIEPMVGDRLHIVEWVRKKMGSFEPAINILDSKLRGDGRSDGPGDAAGAGIAMFCVNSSPADRPTMKEVVTLLREVRSPPDEAGKTSQQPLIKPRATADRCSKNANSMQLREEVEKKRRFLGV